MSVLRVPVLVILQFVTAKSDKDPNPHWFDSLLPDPDPHCAKKLDLDPH